MDANKGVGQHLHRDPVGVTHANGPSNSLHICSAGGELRRGQKIILLLEDRPVCRLWPHGCMKQTIITDWSLTALLND